MKPERRTPRPEVSVTATIAARYGVSMPLARLAVSRGVHADAAELADQADDPRAAFIAAAQACMRLGPAPFSFPPFAVLLDRSGVSR